MFNAQKCFSCNKNLFTVLVISPHIRCGSSSLLYMHNFMWFFSSFQVFSSFSINKHILVLKSRKDYFFFLFLSHECRVCKEDRAKILSVVSSGRIRGNGHKLKCRRFCLNIRKHFFHCEHDQPLAQAAPGACEVSIQKLLEHGYRQTVLGERS